MDSPAGSWGVLEGAACHRVRPSSFRERLPLFCFKLKYNAPQRRVPDILHRVDHWGIESGEVGNYISENRRLSFGPLLEAGPVQLHHNTLAVAMPRTRVARVQPLFEDKEPLAFVAHGVLFWRNDLTGRCHRWMVRFDGHLEESASRRRLIRLAGLEDRDVSSGHLPA